MLKWAIVFAVISAVAGVLGFSGVAAGAAAIAKVLFFVFLALCLIFLALGSSSSRRWTEARSAPPGLRAAPP